MEKLNIPKAVLAGVVGTFAFTVLLLVGPMMGMPKMDMGDMLGPMNPIITMPYALGWVMHFVIGIILTGIYAAFFLDILPSEGWKRGAIWSLIPFLVAMIVVMPMMGMGIFFGGKVMMIMGSLIAHLIYGAAAGQVYGEG